MKCTDLVICRTKKEIFESQGKRCLVIGVYEVKPFRTKKNIVFVHWPVLVLTDATTVLLESFWEHKEGRSPNEREDLIGNKVQAKGIIHSEPPANEGAQNIAIPCISPVEEIKTIQ